MCKFTNLAKIIIIIALLPSKLIIREFKTSQKVPKSQICENLISQKLPDPQYFQYEEKKT